MARRGGVDVTRQTNKSSRRVSSRDFCQSGFASSTSCAFMFSVMKFPQRRSSKHLRARAETEPEKRNPEAETKGTFQSWCAVVSAAFTLRTFHDRSLSLTRLVENSLFQDTPFRNRKASDSICLKEYETSFDNERNCTSVLQYTKRLLITICSFISRLQKL